MDYVVMALFDEETNNFINGIRKEIRDVSLIEKADGWIPHITLGVYREEALDELKAYFKEIADAQTVFYTRFDAMGQFLHNELYQNTDVFIFLPALTPELVLLYSRCHDKNDEYLTEIGKDYQYINGSPTIHSTVAICDTESFVAVMKVLYNKFERRRIRIIGVQIVDMDQNVIMYYPFGENQ